MSNAKKIFYSSRGGVCSIVLGCLIAIYPVLIFKSFVYSLFYLVSFSVCDDANGKEKASNKRLENKEFSFYSVLVILFSSIIIYAIISVLLGAPVYEEIAATLYFSSLMTLLTIYPLTWYYFFCDNVTAILKVLTESKFENILESHFRSILIWTAVGAWVGAFPIPLDWDRPWQKWPITCCIGASLGNSVVHFIIGSKLIYSYFRDRRKIMLCRSV